MEHSGERLRDALRFTLCVWGAYALAEGAQLPLAYMTPVFLIPLLQMPGPVPLALSARLLACAGAMLLGSTFVFGLLADLPLLSLSLQAIGLVAAFWFGARGGNGLLVLIALISLLLVPLLVRLSAQPDAGPGQAVTALLAAALLLAHLAGALVIAFLSWRLLPTGRKPAAPPPSDLPEQQFARALGLTLAVLPLVLWLQRNAAPYPLLPVFVAVLLQKLTAITAETGGRKAVYRHILLKGSELAAASALGGAAAIATYRLLILAPSWALLLAIAFCVIAACAWVLFSGWRFASFAGAACSAYVILIGAALAGVVSTVDAQLHSRLWQLLYAVVYVFFSVAIAISLTIGRSHKEG